MSLWKRFRAWRHERLVRALVYTSVDAMLDMAERQFKEPLTDAEKDRLVKAWVVWITDETRFYAMLDAPVRTVHLFLSEEIS